MLGSVHDASSHWVLGSYAQMSHIPYFGSSSRSVVAWIAHLWGQMLLSAIVGRYTFLLYEYGLAVGQEHLYG